MADIEKARAAGTTVTEQPVKDHASHSAKECPDKRKKSLSERLDDWYLWEVGGVILSAACIVTIVALLIWLDGKKLPRWGFTTPEKTVGNKTIPEKRVDIALNSVISWISTIGKIAILIPITKGLGQLKWVWFSESERRLDDLEKFDSATRGLTGSAKLLWRLKGQHFATIGAIAVILALGFDPFIQNLVHYETVYGPNPEGSNSISSSPSFDYRGVFGELDAYSKGAISAGLYSLNPPSYRVPEYTCGSGNCTWENYPSLAIGVHCVDLTEQLTQNCNGTSVDPVMGAACDYILPNGMNLGRDGRNLLAVNMSRPAIHYTNYTDPIAIVQSIGAFALTDYINSSAVVTASECAMFPAVKTYFSAVGSWYTQKWYDSRPVDGPIEMGPFDTPDQYFEQMVDMFEEYTYVSADNNSADAGYFLKPTNVEELTNIVTGVANDYHMSNQAAVSLRSYLRTLLQGFVRRTEPGARTTTISELNGNSSSDPLWIIYDSDASYQTCFNVANFWGTLTNDAKNVACALDSIAASFTTMMRISQIVSTVPGESAVAITGFDKGTLISPFTQVNVTWGWIILPIIIWCCSIAMVIGTAVKTKKAKVHLWRTNPLAMVFLTLGRDERQEVSQHGGLTEAGLIQRAENIKVKLSVQDGQDIMLRKPRGHEGDLGS